MRCLNSNQLLKITPISSKSHKNEEYSFPGGVGEGVLPYLRYVGLCRWVRSHFASRSLLELQFWPFV